MCPRIRDVDLRWNKALTAALFWRNMVIICLIFYFKNNGQGNGQTQNDVAGTDRRDLN